MELIVIFSIIFSLCIINFIVMFGLISKIFKESDKIDKIYKIKKQKEEDFLFYKNQIKKYKEYSTLSLSPNQEYINKYYESKKRRMG